MKLDTFLSRLEQVKRRGGQWAAKCPAHEDRNPSLSIAEGRDGRILLKCHAGCELTAILSTLGLQAGDLFADHPGKPKRPGTKSAQAGGGARSPLRGLQQRISPPACL